MRRLLILGTGPYAEEMAELVGSRGDYEPVGFVENLDRTRCRDRLTGLPVHWIDDIGALATDHWAVCSLATTERDGFIAQAAAVGMRFATPVHASAQVSPTCTLGDGTFLGAGVIIGAQSSLGRHVRVNRGALIGHHTRIGNLVTIQPGVCISGLCDIGDAATLGVRATVIDRVTIGARSVVCAGALVSRDVPAGATVAGSPARVVSSGPDSDAMPV